MDQPPSQGDFRQHLKAAQAAADPVERLERLARLARSKLGFVETILLGNAIERDAFASADAYPLVRLALLSDCTVAQLLPAISVAGLRHGMRFDVYAGEFGQHRQEVIDQGSGLHSFRPELVLFSLSARRALAGVPLSSARAEAEAALARAVGEVQQLWRSVQRAFGSTVIQQTYLDVFEPVFGSLDRLVPGAPARLVARLNDLIADAALSEKTLLLDVARASARDGIDAWFDTARWLQGKMEIAPQAAPRYGELTARVIAAQRGRSRKCLVLDLDNTLWGGEVGDRGTHGLVLGEGSAQGEAHLALQRHAKLLKERGVILAVCSKNELSTAEAAFRDHPEMVLRRDDFAAFVANWNDKADNLRAIARQLNIGLDSLVFVDDNPVERARVRESLPMVAVPELPADPALYVRCLAESGLFEAVGFTEEDLRRSEQYAANAEREVLRGESQSMDEFLRGLEMSVACGPILPVDLERAAQLINKTNQFNTTARRCSVEQVRALAGAPDHLTFQFRLFDRFGDNGLVSVLILRPAQEDAQALEVDTWVMSCRVFGRQLEVEAMNIAVEAARRRGVRVLLADHVPTERNGVVRGLFAGLGFQPRGAQCEPGAPSRWRLSIAGYTARPTFIKRRVEQRD